MNPPTSSNRKVRDRPFRDRPGRAPIAQDGRRFPLQEQPFRVFAHPARRPGEVVTRQELQARLWPANTYVGFDEGLNTAISKLRTAFGDSAGNPRFIETLPRRGYRFIAPVTETTPVDGLPSSTEVPGDGAQIEGHARLVESMPRGGYPFIGPVEDQSSPALLPGYSRRAPWEAYGRMASTVGRGHVPPPPLWDQHSEGFSKTLGYTATRA